MKDSCSYSNIPLLTAAFLAALTTGGPTYAFGLYGAALKASLHLTQSQLDTLSSSNFCAGFFTWVPGLLVDRWGVRASMMAGGLFGSFFMTVYWLIAKQLLAVEESLILPLLCIFGVLIFMSNGLVIGAIYKILVCTCCPTNKGSAVGVAKGYVGLGAGVYALLFQAFKAMITDASGSGGDGDDLDFLIMAAFVAILTCTLPAWLLLPPQETMNQMMQVPTEKLDRCNKYHFGLLYASLLALGSLVAGTSLADLFTATSTTNASIADMTTTATATATATTTSTTEIADLRQMGTSHVSRGWLMLVVWVGPILVLPFLPAVSPYSSSSDNNDQEENDVLGTVQQQDTENTTEDCSLIVKSKRILYTQRTEPMESTIVDNDDNDDNTPVPFKENYNVVELLQTIPAWLLIWCGIVMVGSGTMMTNNMGQMVESLSFDTETMTPASMAMFSVAQAGSRILTGALSDAALTWQIGPMDDGIPRPVFLIVAAFVGALAHAVLAMATAPAMFIIGILLAGVAFGMVWPLMVLICGEVFGMKNMATNYLLYDGTTSATGTLLFSKFVTQMVYERHTQEDSNTCFGQECFEASQWIVAAACITCAFAGYQMVKLTRHVY